MLLLPAGLTACGGSEGGPGGAKLRTIEQGDAICRDTISKLNALGPGKDKDTLAKAQQIREEARDKIYALPRPEESQETFDTFRANMDNLALTTKAAVEALDRGDQAKADRALSDLEMNRKNADQSAKDFGFKVCSQL